jgi:plastocyanin domain-containing protein
MTRTIGIVSAITLLSVAACSRSPEHNDHASHQTVQQDEHPKGAENAAADTTQRIISVSVGDEGFQPSRVELKRGQDATLRFTRTSDKTCATKVVFPELKVEKDLPLNEAVDVKVPTNEPRELAFQCGMGMYKSAVVIN